jgi:hypothetical protein
MVTHYKCKNDRCDLYDVLVPYVRALRPRDGQGMVCSSCDSRLIVAKTVNVSGGGPRGGGRRSGRSHSRRNSSRS